MKRGLLSFDREKKAGFGADPMFGEFFFGGGGDEDEEEERSKDFSSKNESERDVEMREGG